MANCKTCSVYIGEDGRRRYCDKHREWSDGEWRRKGFLRDYHRKHRQKYNIRITRIVGSGLSEHLCCDKTGKADFIKERIRVRKERKRMGI